MKLDYETVIKKMCEAANSKASWNDYCTEKMMKAALGVYIEESKPNADWWIEHTSKKCPVDENVRVDIMLKNGEKLLNFRAGIFGWKDYGGATILAYRLSVKK